eukprot:Gb_26685 [translate_table: standard]
MVKNALRTVTHEGMKPKKDAIIEAWSWRVRPDICCSSWRASIIVEARPRLPTLRGCCSERHGVGLSQRDPLIGRSNGLQVKKDSNWIEKYARVVVKDKNVPGMFLLLTNLSMAVLPSNYRHIFDSFLPDEAAAIGLGRRESDFLAFSRP